MHIIFIAALISLNQMLVPLYKFYYRLIGEKKRPGESAVTPVGAVIYGLDHIMHLHVSFVQLSLKVRGFHFFSIKFFYDFPCTH